MFEPFKIVSWASAKEDCPITHSVNGINEAIFIFGSGRDAFDCAQ